MNCDQVKELLADYLTEGLDETAKHEVHSHMAACAACKEEVERLEETWTRMELLSGEQPDISLRARFYTMLEAYMQGRGETRPASVRAKAGDWIGMLWPNRPVLQIAFSVLFLVLGVGIGRFSNTTTASRTGDGEVAKLREEVHNMVQLVTISLLQQQSASERLRGLSWSQRVSQPDPEVLSALLQVLNYDSNVDVRLAAVDALSQFSGQQHVRQGLIQALTRQSSPLVQIALIDLLVSLHERNSVDMLKHLVKEQNLNESVKQRAEWGLKQLS